MNLKTNNNDIFRFAVYNDPSVELEPIHWNFIPLEYERFITICVDNEYKYWEEVIELVAPSLFIKKIGIIAFSIQDAARQKKCLNINRIKIRNASFILKKSLGNFCGQDWSLALAQNNNNHFCFVKTGDEKYLFKPTEEYIEDLHRPEIIAKEILKRLGIDQEIYVDTQLIGPSYTTRILEVVPDFNLEGQPNIDENTVFGIRCDLFENWDFVFQSLQLGLSPVVTCKSLPDKSVLGFLTGVSLLNIYIDENFDVSRVETARSVGIQYQLMCNVEDPERLKEIKRKFFDFPNIIFLKNWGKENLDKLSKLPYDTKIKSKRLLASKDGTFLSVGHWREKTPINNPKGSLLLDFNENENEEFLSEADLFYYYI